VRRLCLVIALLVAGRARAEPTSQGAVALLPLDAAPKLELFSQPVASAMATALTAGGIDVVVVGPHSAVPERARLVVDGTITGKGQAIIVTLRVRDRKTGAGLDKLESTAPSLNDLDRVTADLSGRLLPVVRDHLAAVDQPRPEALHEVKPAPSVATAPAALAPMLAAVSIFPAPTGASPCEPLRAALDGAVASWARAHHREPTAIEGPKLSRDVAVKTLDASADDLAVSFVIFAYVVDKGAIPLAHARVRLRVVHKTHGAGEIVFDRVIVTDSVVGEKGIAPDALAARTAREVLAIAEPNLRRALGSWP